MLRCSLVSSRIRVQVFRTYIHQYGLQNVGNIDGALYHDPLIASVHCLQYPLAYKKQYIVKLTPAATKLKKKKSASLNSVPCISVDGSKAQRLSPLLDELTSFSIIMMDMYS